MAKESIEACQDWPPFRNPSCHINDFICESSLKYLKTCSVTPLLKIAREATWQGRKFLVIEAKESFCPILHPSIFEQADQGLDLQASHVKQNWLVNNKIRPYLHLAFFLRAASYGCSPPFHRMLKNITSLLRHG